MKIANDLIQSYLDWAIVDPGNRQYLLAASIFDRGSSARVLCSQIQTAPQKLKILNEKKQEKFYLLSHVSKDDGYYTVSRPEIVPFDQDRILRYQVIQSMVSERYLITSCEDSILNEDVYSYLMRRFDLPLKREWIPEILKRLEEENACSMFYEKATEETIRRNSNPFLIASATLDRIITVGNRKINLNDIVLIKFGVHQKLLDKVVSELIVKGKTPITTPELDKRMLLVDVSSMDNYFAQQHKYLIENVLKSLNILSESNGRIETLACKAKTPYMEQGQAVNGLVELFNSGSKYGLALCDMGTGKTLMGISVVESFAVKKWLKSHPGKTVRDAYMTPDEIRYRVGIVGPGHMVEKWESEILKVIPYAKVRQINSFEQVAKLKNVKPEGREFLIFGKDFAKGNYTYGPIPTQLKSRHLAEYICADCLNAGNIVVQEQGEKNCLECGGKKWVRRELPERRTGMICPSCGEMLLTGNRSEDRPLTDLDFMTLTSINQYCSHCSAPLWGVEAAPEGNGLTRAENRAKTKWKRMSFSTTHSGKTKKTVYVLPKTFKATDGTLKTQVNPKIWTLKSMKSVPRESAEIHDPVGVRKMSPAIWMKKHLNADFFDFLILDEAHQYTNESAQSHAAHCLIKISKRVLGLTGTLANGSAGNTFHLLWMLDPQKMRRNFKYESRTAFVERYGTYEESFYLASTDRASVTDRGAKQGSRKEKAGISISLYIDYFAEKAVTMSIKDFRSVLPEFIEQVITVPMEDHLADAYRSMSRNYESLIKTLDQGNKLLGIYQQHALYWPDLPNSRDVISPSSDDVLMSLPDLTPELMAEGKLLKKEEKLLEIVSKEIAAGRNTVIYLQCTGNGEARITERIYQLLISSGILMQQEIGILEAKVQPAKREAWIRDQARSGMKCLITNPQLVETGLDFIFEEDGTVYNFPTLIYYQVGYKLATMWQSSRRSYRLIQRETCRVYYLAYENTLAVTCLEMLADKEYAASILQGQFSAGALAAMAKTVDPRVRIAKALKEGSYGNVDAINAVFAKANAVEVGALQNFEPAPDFYKLTGLVDDSGMDRSGQDYEQENIFDADFKEFEAYEPESAEEEKAAVQEMPTAIEEPEPDELWNGWEIWNDWDSWDGGGTPNGKDAEVSEEDEVAFNFSKDAKRRKKKIIFTAPKKELKSPY